MCAWVCPFSKRKEGAGRGSAAAVPEDAGFTQQGGATQATEVYGRRIQTRGGQAP